MSKLILITLLCWQLTSDVVNKYMTYKKKLKIQRNSFFFVGAPYVVFLLFYSQKIKKIYIDEVLDAGIWKVPVTEILIITVGMIIAMWYFTICFRELKVIIKKMT